MFKRNSILAAFATLFVLASSVASAQYSDRRIRISTGVSGENPVALGIKKMQEVLTDKTGGKLKLIPYYGGVLGGDNQAVQALRGGTQEMVITASSPLIGVLKEIGIFDFPFLFANEKEADAVLDGPAGDYFNKRLEEFGLVNLAYWENGFRNLTNSKRPVKTLDDIAGLKIRVMQNNVYLDTFKELKVNAVPMSYGELYTALETKTVDGQENPNINMETFKINEVQKYLSITRHAYTPWLVLYSKKLWDQLSNQERAVLREAAIEGRKAQREGNRVLDAKSLDSLKAKGMIVFEFTKEERNRMIEKTKPVYDKYLAIFDKTGPELVFSTLKTVRGE